MRRPVLYRPMMTWTSAATRSWRLALTAVLAGAALAASLRAHDSEQTRVTLNFAPDGRFDLVVSNDANWLLLRLELSSANPAYSMRRLLARVEPPAA